MGYVKWDDDFVGNNYLTAPRSRWDESLTYVNDFPEKIYITAPRCNGKSLTDLARIHAAGLESYIRNFEERQRFMIKKVIFNPPATIVIWEDNTKTVVKCGDKDYYDPEKGLAMAISKKFFGNKGNYYSTFKKWLPPGAKQGLYPFCYDCVHAHDKLTSYPCNTCSIFNSNGALCGKSRFVPRKDNK